MDDPLNPGPITPLDDERLNPQSVPEDTRPFWTLLFTSLRPSVSQEKMVRTGKTATEVEIKGHVDF